MLAKSKQLQEQNKVHWRKYNKPRTNNTIKTLQWSNENRDPSNRLDWTEFFSRDWCLTAFELFLLLFSLVVPQKHSFPFSCLTMCELVLLLQSNKGTESAVCLKKKMLTVQEVPAVFTLFNYVELKTSSRLLPVKTERRATAILWPRDDDCVILAQISSSWRR